MRRLRERFCIIARVGFPRPVPFIAFAARRMACSTTREAYWCVQALSSGLQSWIPVNAYRCIRASGPCTMRQIVSMESWRLKASAEALQGLLRPPKAQSARLMVR